MSDDSAVLMIGPSSKEINIYYKTRFMERNAIVFIQQGGVKTLIVGGMELGRAGSESVAEEVRTYEELQARWSSRKKAESPVSSFINTVEEVLKEKGIKKLIVPAGFGVVYADELRGRGYELEARREPFFPERARKTEEEVRELRRLAGINEKAMEEAVELIRGSDVGEGGKLFHEGKELSAQKVKTRLNRIFIEHGCFSDEPIVACGDQGCDPHNTGSGCLYAGETIVLDLCPRSYDTYYFSDMTRTVVKGEPKPGVREMYAAVESAQEIAFSMLRSGIDGKDVHLEIERFFEKEGFRTEKREGRWNGYFHGTGHGVGLEVHELPRIGGMSEILEVGNVVTVEPGLYYFGKGAVRLEDIVLVKEGGCENFMSYKKELVL